MAKAELNHNFKEFLKSSNRAKVRHLLIGGYAINAYGYRRFTLDLNVRVAVDAANAEKISSVWQRFAGFSARQVPPDMFPRKGAMFRFGRTPSLIELITKISGVNFETCYARRTICKIDGIKSRRFP